MAVDETDIVNVALRMIAGKPITALDDGTTNGNIASDLYTIVRDELLRAHTWRFATKLVKLTRLATAPTHGYDYAYGFPADWLRTVRVSDNDANVGHIRYEEAEIAGVGALMSSAESLYLQYIYTLTDTNRMSAGFVKALATALARDMALPVGNSNTMREEYTVQAKTDLRIAKSTDSQGSPARQPPVGSWVTERHGLSSTIWPR